MPNNENEKKLKGPKWHESKNAQKTRADAVTQQRVKNQIIKSIMSFLFMFY